MLLLNPADIAKQRKAIERSAEPTGLRARAFERFEAMLGYCETAECREAALLAYLGEEAPACGRCDNCRSRALGQDVSALMARYLDEQALWEDGRLDGVRPAEILESLTAEGGVSASNWDAALRQLILHRALEPDGAGGFRRAASIGSLEGRIRSFDWPPADRGFTLEEGEASEQASAFVRFLADEGVQAKWPQRLIRETVCAAPRTRAELAALRRYSKVLDPQTEQTYLRAALTFFRRIG